MQSAQLMEPSSLTFSCLTCVSRRAGKAILITVEVLFLAQLPPDLLVAQLFPWQTSP